jgi:peroxiredoxin
VLAAERNRPTATSAATAPQPDGYGIPPGELAPSFELRGACDGPASLESLRSAGVPVVLMFLRTGCGVCSTLHPHLRRWQIALADRVSIAVIVDGADAARDLCTEHRVENVLVDDRSNPVRLAYQMPTTPSAVAVSPYGRVASDAVRGADAIEELVRQTIRLSPVPGAAKEPSPVA